MNIGFMSRDEALEAISCDAFLKSDLDLISISDTHKEAKQMRDAWKKNKKDTNAAIFLVFYDVENDMSGFTQNKARQIVNFIDISHKKKKNIAVHCFVGISRSGAVAKFINDYLGLENLYVEEYKHHNKHIYYTLLEAAGIQTMRSYYGGNND